MMRFPMILLACVLVSAPAQAQSRWALSFTIVPRWEFPDALARAGESEDNLRGAEFALGIERVRARGGDWGLTIRNITVASDSEVGRRTVCVDNTDAQPICARKTFHRFSDTSLLALQLHKTWTIFRIKSVALGLSGAIGAGKFRGDVEEHIQHVSWNGSSLVVQEEVSVLTAQRAVLGDVATVVPLLSLEPAVTSMLSSNVRLRVSSGFNLPGVRVPAVAVQYVF